MAIAKSIYEKYPLNLAALQFPLVSDKWKDTLKFAAGTSLANDELMKHIQEISYGSIYSNDLFEKMKNFSQVPFIYDELLDQMNVKREILKATIFNGLENNREKEITEDEEKSKSNE